MNPSELTPYRSLSDTPGSDMAGGADGPLVRLAGAGPDALSAGELLTVLLGSGAGGPRSQGRALRILGRLGGLRRLSAATPAEVQAAGRCSALAAARVAAAFALGRRALAECLGRGWKLTASAEIFEAFHARMRVLRKERFVAVMLDARNRVLREDVISEGILTASLVHPREVFGPALREGCAGLFLVHNHPSGDPDPSPEDYEVTRPLVAVGQLVGIQVLDHVVIGDGCYVSFLERGVL
jgi:DNA repair protein RadC